MGGHDIAARDACVPGHMTRLRARSPITATRKGFEVQAPRSTNAAAEHTAVPAQRAGQETPAELAAAGLRALDELAVRVDGAVASIDDAAMNEPCALPGWSRAHLVTHLARNADALVNLLHWARTGIEQAAYASDEDRDADIEEGAQRLPQLIREDYLAATGRFRAAAKAMPERAWRGTATNRQGAELYGHHIPWMRATELLVHLVDLDVGFGFADLGDLSPEALASVLDYVVHTYTIIDDAPAVRIRAGDRDYTVGDRQPEYDVAGSPVAVVAWLTGRTGGSELSGTVPPLPDWLK